MKLKKEVIITKNNNEYIIVATGNVFAGMIKVNSTAAYIAECLKKETDESCIVEGLMKKYNVSQEVAIMSVKSVVEKLASVGLVENE